MPVVEAQVQFGMSADSSEVQFRSCIAAECYSKLYQEGGGENHQNPVRWQPTYKHPSFVRWRWHQSHHRKFYGNCPRKGFSGILIVSVC